MGSLDYSEPDVLQENEFNESFEDRTRDPNNNVGTNITEADPNHIIENKKSVVDRWRTFFIEKKNAKTWIRCEPTLLHYLIHGVPGS